KNEQIHRHHIIDNIHILKNRIIQSLEKSGNIISKVLVTDKAIDRFRGKVREMLSPRNTNESTGVMIQKLNRLIRGWCEYYRITSSPSWAFERIQTELFWDFAHWLGRKYEIRHMSDIMRRFRKGKALGKGARTLMRPK